MKKRKILVLGMTIITMLSSIAFADYVTIYEDKTEAMILAEGVVQTQIRRFTNGGWININLIEVDLEKEVEISVISDDYLSSRSTLSNLVEKSDEAARIVAATNSDFFDTANNTTMGLLIKESEILTTSMGLDEFASFNISESGIAFISYLNNPQNSFTNGKYELPITFINKPYLGLDYDRTILYNQNWATSSYGNTLGKDIVEVLVVEDLISDIRLNGDPYQIPSNGYVIASVGGNIQKTINNFKIGDSVNLDYDVTLDAIETAIGGGAQILSSGEIPTTFSQNISGNNPRTAVGITKDRKKVLLMTVDGRSASYRGVTQTELAALMREFGAYEALNLDGGGSTEMIVKSPWKDTSQIFNSPSDGTERRMYTGLVVLKNVVENAELKAIQIDLESTDLILGAGQHLDLKAIDSNYDDMKIDSSAVTWQISGVDGRIKENIFYPNETGTGLITATYSGLSASKTIMVYDNGVKILADPSILQLEQNQTKQITFYIQTEEGKKIPIDSSLLSVETHSEIGKYDHDKSAYEAIDSSGQDYLTIEFNDLITYLPISIGFEKALLLDFETSVGTFLGYPESVTGKYQEITYPKNGKQAGLLEYNFESTTETRAAYMIFNEAIVLPSNTEAIGMWVYGDYGNDHWLRGRLTDAQGVDYNITFARRVDWDGWQYVTAEIPVGIQTPFSLSRIYLAETNVTMLDSGTIIVDDISAVVSNELPTDIPKDITKIKKIDDYQLSDVLVKANAYIKYGYLSASIVDEQKIDLEKVAEQANIELIKANDAYQLEEKQNCFILHINNSEGGIRKNGYIQWTNLLSQLDSEIDKPLIVLMNDVYLFNDVLEENLFFTKLYEYVSKGYDVVTVFPSDTDSFTRKMKNGVEILSVPKTRETLKHIKIGVNNNKIEFEISK